MSAIEILVMIVAFNAIYVMNAADGGNVTRLTDTDAYYADLDWGGTDCVITSY